ncbi:unnamed protein product, partial [Prorocentrum cordatum]
MGSGALGVVSSARLHGAAPAAGSGRGASIHEAFRKGCADCSTNGITDQFTSDCTTSHADSSTDDCTHGGSDLFPGCVAVNYQVEGCSDDPRDMHGTEGLCLILGEKCDTGRAPLPLHCRPAGTSRHPRWIEAVPLANARVPKKSEQHTVGP